MKLRPIFSPIKHLLSLIALCLITLTLPAANVTLSQGPGMDGIGGSIGDGLGGDLSDGIGGPPATEIPEQPQNEDEEDDDNDGNDDEGGGCASGDCNQEACDRASSSAGAGSVRYQIGLGRAEYMADGMLRDGGVLFRLRHDSIKNETAYQRPLRDTMMLSQPPTGDLRTDGTARMRQVLTRTLFADFTDLPAGDGISGYKVSIYRVDKTKPTIVSGYYNPASLPANALLKVITVRNPDGTALQGRFEILEEDYFVPENAPRRQTIYWEEGDNDAWLMEKYAGVRGEASAKITRRVRLSDRALTGGPFGEYRQTRTVEKADSVGQLRTVISYSERCAKYSPVETAQLERTLTVDGVTRTNLREYHTAITNEAAFGRPKIFRRWDGYWETYDYAPAMGEYTLITVRRPWLNSVFGDNAHCVEESWLENRKLKISLNHTKKIAGQVVFKTTLDRREQNDGTLVSTEYRWTSNSGSTDPLVTKRVYYSATNANSFLRGRLKSEENPDGTVALYTYEKLADGTTRFTTQYGAGTLASVTDGTKTVRLVEANGQLLDEVQTDIASGLQLYCNTAVTGAVDPFGRVTEYSHNGDATDSTFERYGSCGALLYRRDSDGRETRNQYDEQKRLTRSETGYPGEPSIVTEYEYTFASTGKVTRQRVIAGGQISETVTTRNAFGDIVSIQTPDTDGDGTAELTTYALEALSDGTTRATATYPDGATSIRENYRDGQTRRISGTAEIETHHIHGLWVDGQWRETRVGNATSETWTKSYSDLLDRNVKTEQYLGGGAVATTTSQYNAQGQLITTIAPDGLATLYAYNAKGEMSHSAVDLNGNGTIDLAGPDQVNGSENRYVNDSTLGVCRENKTLIWTRDGNAESVVTATFRSSLDGRKSHTDSYGRISTSITTPSVNGSYTSTSTDPTGVVTVGTYVRDQLQSQIAKTSDNILLRSTTYSYNRQGQVLTQTDARLGTTQLEYDNAGQVIAQADPIGNRTEFAYDKRGRLVQTKYPDGTTQHTAYDARGQVIRQWGSQTYTQANVYDAQGRMVELHTFKDSDGSTPQVTRWHYDAGGRLLRKEYADDTGPSYTYDIVGRLLTRTWARHGANGQLLETFYNYNATGQLEHIYYSDGITPEVHYTYNRMGQPLTVTDGAGTRTYSYRTSDLMLADETVAGLLNETIHRDYDTLGRLTQAVLSGQHTVSYGYDSAGRLKTLTGNGATHTYNYLANSSLIASVTSPTHTVTNTYEPHRDVLLTKENKVGSTTISKHTYTVNNLGQRTKREQSGSAFATPSTESFAYNAKGEVVGSTNSQRPALNANYSFDGIGNRQTSLDSFGQRSYSANALNQYLSVTIMPSVVNNPTYDSDGNMLTDGSGMSYVWDGENRLIRVMKPDGIEVRYTYDSESRRAKREQLHNGVIQSTILYLYDGWNLLTECEYAGTDIAAEPIKQKAYVWGLDLSGSLQEAGGVGGLLSVRDEVAIHHLAYDGNGNVSELLDSVGAIQAHYEYDPFGNLTASSRALAASNSWRFSTKPMDVTNGLYYYGYRFYDAKLGRWINRDPANERGGVNSYGFVRNNVVDMCDILGLVDLNLFYRYDKEWSIAEELKTSRSVFSVASHGSATSLQVLGNLIVSGKVAAAMIRSQYDFALHPRTILLLACSAGAPVGVGVRTVDGIICQNVAQDIANELGVPVLAPTTRINYIREYGGAVT